MELRTFVGTLLFAMPVGLVLLWGGGLLGLDPDWLLHVVYGAAVLRHGPWLPGDPTVYTAPEGFTPVLHEWAAEAAYALLGAKGSLAFAALVLGGVVTWVYVRTERVVGHRYGLAVALVVFLGLATSMTVRPHLWSFLGLSALLALLERHERGAALPVTAAGVFALTAAWVNLHGGVVMAFLPLAVLPRSPRSTAALLAAAVLGVSCNPWGPGLWLHVAVFLQSDAPRVADDFQPTWKAAGIVLAHLAVLGAVAAHHPARAGRGRDVVLVALLAVLGLTAHRNVMWLGLGVGWSAARWVEGAAGDAGRPVRLWPGLAAVAAWLALAPPVVVRGAVVPTAAAAWLTAHPEVVASRGYAGYADSGYLVGLGVVDRVYLHGLTANLPLSLSTEYRHVLGPAAEGWEDLLDRHGVRWILARPDEPLASAVAASPRWTTVFHDEAGATLWLRR